MEYFLLEHPSDRIVLCDCPGCDRVADYVEVDADRESHVRALHTTSRKYVSRLPERRPNPKLPYRVRAAAA
jgi:hypothetical protein